jgi:hypothetical protein
LYFYFFLWSFCKSFIGFQFHISIQIDDIMLSNLILIVLIFNFFSWPFIKSYYSFQLHPSIKIFVLSFISTLTSFFDFFPFTKLIFLFNFILQSNIEFILFFNFDHHYVNCYFF